jgi:hypothetical protein
VDRGVGVGAKIFAYWMRHADIVARMPGLAHPLASGARVSRSDVFSEAGAVPGGLEIEITTTTVSEWGRSWGRERDPR